MVMHPSTIGQTSVEDLAHQGVLPQVSQWVQGEANCYR